MFDASFDGAALRWSSVVLVLFALSPAPLILPSGVALAVIGLMGAASLLIGHDGRKQPRSRVADSLSCAEIKMCSRGHGRFHPRTTACEGVHIC